MCSIIRIVNANANDSHVDLRMSYGVVIHNIRGSETKSVVLNCEGNGIIQKLLKE